MFPAIWVILWSVTAVTTSQLLAPAAAVGIRMFYLDRKLVVFSGLVWLSWAMLFLVNVRYSGIEHAVRFAIMLIVCATVLAHAFGRFRYGGRVRMFRATVFQWYRSKEMVTKRFRDLAFVIEMRAGNERWKTFRQMKLWCTAVPGAFAGLVELEKQTRVLIESRGGVPESNDWLAEESGRIWAIPLADAIVLVAIVAAMWGGASVLLPLWILSAVGGLS